MVTSADIRGMTMRGFVMMAAAAAVAAPAVAAPTTVVFDQFAPRPAGILNYAASALPSQQCRTPGCGFNFLVIDDFTLTGTTRLTSLSAMYANGFSMFSLPFVENWQVDVFTSPTAALGFGAGDVASMIVTSGVSLSAAPSDLFSSGARGVVTVPIDVTLAAGSYWLGLRPKLDDGNGSFNVLASSSDPNRVGNFWVFQEFGGMQFFENTPGGAYYQLSGQAVPEPASWAMLIAGFGLVGAAARRRRVLAA